MPGKPSASRSASTSFVITPRSSAITGSSPSSASAARKTDFAGAGEPVAGASVELVRPFGIAQKAAKPRK